MQFCGTLLQVIIIILDLQSFLISSTNIRIIVYWILYKSVPILKTKIKIIYVWTIPTSSSKFENGT